MIFKKLIKYILFNFSAIFKFFFINTREEFHSNKFVISHNLGGGTLFYEKQQSYTDYIIVRKLGMGKDCFFELSFSDKKKYVRKVELIKKLNTSKEIIISSLVSYDSIHKWLQYFSDLKIKNRVKLCYLVHDFHCVCKNNFTLINNDFYCGIKCEECSKNKKNEIKIYQNRWFSFLKNCEEIRCFSYNTKQILEFIFGQNELKLTVVPHNVDYCKQYEKIDYSMDNLKIGIVGNCNTVAKGRNIVKDFSSYCKKNGYELFFIGKVNNSLKQKSKFLHYLGKYNKTNLSRILFENKVNCIFFTSVWPETFSYVISELMSLDIPIATFKIGAQYEKLKSYNKFIELNETTSEYIYSKINNYFSKDKL